MGSERWTFNRGEWSEPYTFLKLLADGRLYSADPQLNKLPDVFYPILHILRQETDGEAIRYSLGDGVVKIHTPDAYTPIELPVDLFKRNSEHLLNKLRESSGRGSTFPIPETESFLREIHITNPKSSSRDKRDITIVVHDPRTGATPELGFSIKSQLGGKSTLLNPSQSTNFVYRVTGTHITDHQISEINRLEVDKMKIEPRIHAIEALNGELEFVGTSNPVFGQNLRLIDDALPDIIAHLLLEAQRGSSKILVDVLDVVIQNNPLGYNTDHNHPFYEYKVKKFLVEVALGMRPATVWNGQYDATGGYIVVKNDGELVCYHVYARNLFENYLLQNVRFETPGTTRNKFGTLYRHNGDLFFNLNLQIRFKN